MGSKADLEWANQISKVLGLSNPDTRGKIVEYQEKQRKELEEADQNLMNYK